ncbi:LamG-like jellyroll fold domain-containing protein [Bremerella sp. P1]|uniref:LamG-like jellyroll fold domain-containing protein n=1 Tax=Bremerella sp. P1 TaxID=3026424 RepID=UPI0023682525|nr:LamG-like jellyroll fold domain-containing protein [Bremerella sp. P1]WDI39879.1 GYF domain-containing protein [Bremerella sp. P1]
MTNEWFLADDGKGYGPFSASQLEKLVETGVIEPDDLVWRDGDLESIPASVIGSNPPPPLPDGNTPKTSRSLNMKGWGGVALWTLVLMIIGFGIVAQFRDEPTAWARVSGAIQDLRDKITGEDLVQQTRESLDRQDALLRRELQAMDERVDAAAAATTPKPQQPDSPEKNPSKTSETANVNSPEIPTNVGGSVTPDTVFSLTFDDNYVPRSQLAAKGIVLVDGIDGRAAAFKDRRLLQVPCKLPAGKAPRTLSAWIKNGGESEARNSHVISCGKDEFGKRAWGICHVKGRWCMYGWGGQHSTDAVVDREWHHHCLTFDGTTVLYWFDGKVVANVSRTLDTTNGPITLGTYTTGSTYYAFSGVIDELAVYDVALTEEQVARLANRRPR